MSPTKKKKKKHQKRIQNPVEKLRWSFQPITISQNSFIVDVRLVPICTSLNTIFNLGLIRFHLIEVYRSRHLQGWYTIRRWLRDDILFSFCFFVYFLLSFLFYYFILIFSFVPSAFCFCLHIVFTFFSIPFHTLKQSQMKTKWLRADRAPKINQDGRALTFACAATECQIKRCKKFTYFTCATYKATKQVMIASFACY